jgi:hypothetical protein
MGLPGPLAIRLAATVQPGCTNLWVGTLLHSRADADADRCIGRQVRAKLNTNLEWPSFSHTFILGEHTANINSPRTLQLFVIGDAVASEIGCPIRLRQLEWNQALIGRKVLAVNCFLRITALLFMLNAFAFCQTPYQGSDCSTLKYARHKISCLCGTVQVCSGDLGGPPTHYGLDDDITVQLRNKAGATVLDSKKGVVETRERECTTQIGTKVPCPTTERTFCFDGKRDGDYQLAFILSKNGVLQPAIKFPTNYSRKSRKSCNSVYMVEPSCPTTLRTLR